jgi:NADPH:quinone reductase-like Zn-dependent oxidoreductase
MTTPEQMKAVVCRTYGPPEIARIEEVDCPLPGDHELLVRVHATTVNRTDCGYRAPSPFLMRLFAGLRRPKWPILGTEFAGEVVGAGSAVTLFAAGDRICGYCEGTFGAHAEYMSLAEDRLIARIPQGRSFEDAAPSTEGAHYALGMLRAAKIGPGRSVLVYGATGAIGSAAVQLAKSLGATVTAICPTQHVEMMKRLGADRVVDYLTTDFTKDDEKYDLVLDAVGKRSFGAVRHMLKPRGIYISSDLGPFVQNPFLALLAPLSRGRKVMFPLPRRDLEAIRYLRGLIESGEFRPVVDRVYPLAQIAEAYRYVETGKKVGNVVITV